MIKENADIFSNFTCQSLNNMIDFSIFPKSLKVAYITPVFKKGPENLRKIIDL